MAANARINKKEASLALDRKSRALAKMVCGELLLIRSWCGIRAGFLGFTLARRRVLWRHHQKHQASAQFFGKLGGTLFQFEADPVRGAIARRVGQSAVYLQHGAHWHSRSRQQADQGHKMKGVVVG